METIIFRGELLVLGSVQYNQEILSSLMFPTVLENHVWLVARKGFRKEGWSLIQPNVVRKGSKLSDDKQLIPPKKK